MLVCTFAVVLSVCQKSSDSSSSSSGIAYADFKPSDVTYIMHCFIRDFNSSGTNAGLMVYSSCDTSDSTSLGDVVSGSNTREYAITLDDLASAGFRPCSRQYAGYMFCR